MGADLAETPLYVSIRDYFTKQPYITADGQTSLNIPVESVEVNDVMWEPKVNDISTAKITLPSLIAQPGLRPLFQQIKEGNRVEVFHFQPDAGDPVFAGFLPPEGIEEQDGKVILNVEDTLGQLKWQHLRRFEYLNGPAADLYTRAISVWRDYVNEDFLGTNPAADYDMSFNLNGAVPIWGQGFFRLNSSGTLGCATSPGPLLAGLTGPVAPGDTWVLECDSTIFTAFAAAAFCQVYLRLNCRSDAPAVGAYLDFRGSNYSGGSSYPTNMLCDARINNLPNGVNTQPTAGTSQLAGSFPMPSSHRLACWIQFGVSSVTVLVYLDNVNISVATQPWIYDNLPFTPDVNLQANLTGDWVQITSWRARKLVSIVTKAGRFNPQTTDAVTYQPNNEENLQFLQLIAEKDGAEYRPIYRAWPQRDELELDASGVLGQQASRILGYEQPPNIPVGGSPEPAPFAVITDAASFLVAPPFRFEEGFNLESPPQIQPRANAHSNDVIRVGSSTADAQVFGEKWLTSEVGRPQHTPNGASYPYFDQITNDDRVGIQTLATSLAGLELARRTDGTPSLSLDVVEELPFAFRWRAGDQILVKTQSLRNNLEQEMRVQKVQYRAGSPVRTAIMGKTDWDPTMQRLLAEDTKISWLYDQSGTNPGIYVYPFSGNISAGATSAAFTIPLDAYTTGSALIYAALHWFTDGNVLLVQPIINGQPFYLTGLVAPSTTDSGLVFATQCFQSKGTYQLQFKNNDSGVRNLTAAFLVLRIKG